MAHHAFFVAGDREEGIEAALSFLARERGLASLGNPDVIVERHGLFRAEDARRIAAKAGLKSMGEQGKALVIAASRIFHEAQNGLLKTFEEPPEDTTLILVIPSEGDLLPTMRSRLQPLPSRNEDERKNTKKVSEEAETFWKGSAVAREKVVEVILKEAKSDDEDDKLAARACARSFVEGLAVLAYDAWRKKETDEGTAFLKDLDRLIPLLKDRSAPLKPILEHILLVAPK